MNFAPEKHRRRSALFGWIAERCCSFSIPEFSHQKKAVIRNGFSTERLKRFFPRTVYCSFYTMKQKCLLACKYYLHWHSLRRDSISQPCSARSGKATKSCYARLSAYIIPHFSSYVKYQKHILISCKQHIAFFHKAQNSPVFAPFQPDFDRMPKQKTKKIHSFFIDTEEKLRYNLTRLDNFRPKG